ncbi:MAG: hypothetical protein GKR89_06620 [Candidatus Latescibacteria bacterium]|nr:hypothetical protein [Candidatus Latescibacterota bacterium]
MTRDQHLDPRQCTLFSGGAKGAEAEFGRQAQRLGVGQVNFTFAGHQPVNQQGLRHLGRGDLLKGDISLSYIARRLNRTYTHSSAIRRVLQSIWHQVNSSQAVYVVGAIQADDTVRGGTGWGAEFAKLCAKPLFVFDQDRDDWFCWRDGWQASATPVIAQPRFAGTGTRFLQAEGRAAIAALMEGSFARQPSPEGAD